MKSSRSEKLLPRTGEAETPTNGLCKRPARVTDEVEGTAVMVAISLQYLGESGVENEIILCTARMVYVTAEFIS